MLLLQVIDYQTNPATVRDYGRRFRQAVGRQSRGFRGNSRGPRPPSLWKKAAAARPHEHVLKLHSDRCYLKSLHQKAFIASQLRRSTTALKAAVPLDLPPPKAEAPRVGRVFSALAEAQLPRSSEVRRSHHRKYASTRWVPGRTPPNIAGNRTPELVDNIAGLARMSATSTSGACPSLWRETSFFRQVPVCIEEAAGGKPERRRLRRLASVRFTFEPMEERTLL